MGLGGIQVQVRGIRWILQDDSVRDDIQTMKGNGMWVDKVVVWMAAGWMVAAYGTIVWMAYRMIRINRRALQMKEGLEEVWDRVKEGRGRGVCSCELGEIIEFTQGVVDIVKWTGTRIRDRKE